MRLLPMNLKGLRLLPVQAGSALAVAALIASPIPATSEAAANTNSGAAITNDIRHPAKSRYLA